MERAERKQLAEEERARRPPFRVRCCMAAGCLSGGAEPVRTALEAAVDAAGRRAEIGVSGVGCLRWCGEGPLVRATPAAARLPESRPAPD